MVSSTTERSGERPFTGTYLDAKSVKQGISKRALARALTLLNSPQVLVVVTWEFDLFSHVYEIWP